MKYVLCTGYVPNSKTPITSYDFYPIWLENNRKYCSPAPLKTVILSSGDQPHPAIRDWNTVLIDVGHNHGHIQSNIPNRQLCGWTAHLFGGMMTAFNFGVDFIFKEQDCLAFGPWVEQLYKDMGDSGMVIGQGLKAHPKITTTNSLLLIKHDYILPFMRDYLSLPWDDNADWMPEKKFAHLFRKSPDKIKVMSFGVDRDRPMPMDSTYPWYAQQINLEEYNQLKEKGLV